jgi:hypothetical protein
LHRSCIEAIQYQISESISGEVFGFPDRSQEEKHLETFGRFSLPGLWLDCAQLGYICGIAAHETNYCHDRSDDEIVEYEFDFSEERVRSDLKILSSAEEKRSVIGRWPLDHYRIQRWLYTVTEHPTHPEYEGVAQAIIRLYHEVVLELLDDGPFVRHASTMPCLCFLIDMYFATDLSKS